MRGRRALAGRGPTKNEAPGEITARMHPGPVVGIVGLGYVGVATAVAFAYYARTVVSYDISHKRREEIRTRQAPMLEKDLPVLLRRVASAGQLRVTESMDELVRAAQVLFLCTATPSLDGGAIDLRSLERAARDVGQALDRIKGWRSVVVKSTTLPGTADSIVAPTVAQASGRTVDEEFGVASNPEFLAEGSLVFDALHPSRIVLGVRESKTEILLRRAYAGFPGPVLVMSPSAAELVKYASNGLLATKVSFANEIARVAETLGVDVDHVMEAVGKDPRLGSDFLRAGPGFGGSCFEKDLKSLLAFAKSREIDLRLVDATLQVNRTQAVHVVDLASRAAGGLRSRTVALLGLSFKPGIDDVRGSQAYPILRELLERGATVRLHDPRAGLKFWQGIPPAWATQFSGHVTLCRTLTECLGGADLVLIHTDWPQYRRAPLSTWGALNLKLVVDSRRTLNSGRLGEAGVRYVAVGR